MAKILKCSKIYFQGVTTCHDKIVRYVALGVRPGNISGQPRWLYYLLPLSPIPSPKSARHTDGGGGLSGRTGLL